MLALEAPEEELKQRLLARAATSAAPTTPTRPSSRSASTSTTPRLPLSPTTARRGQVPRHRRGLLRTSPTAHRRDRRPRHGQPNFVDAVKICRRSGKGGQGSTHMHRDKTTAKGGPDGGDGGRGVTSSSVARPALTLLHLKYQRHVIAAHGEGGSGNRKHGADGKDAVIEVPLGTGKDSETGETQFEITEHGQTGWPRPRAWRVGKRPLQVAHQPSPACAAGEDGREEWKILELKLLADVGLVGSPTREVHAVERRERGQARDRRLSLHHPSSQLGMGPTAANKSFVMADIPGIIEGPRKGGWACASWSHRTQPGVVFGPADADDIPAEYATLRRELEKYNPDLMRSSILAVSKCDMLDDELERELRAELAQHLDVPPLLSSVAQQGLQPPKDACGTPSCKPTHASQPPFNEHVAVAVRGRRSADALAKGGLSWP